MQKVNFDILEFAKNLSRNARMEDVLKHSSVNHHVNGVDYVCLHRSDNLTVKLYNIAHWACGDPGNIYLVDPHDHRYNFHSFVLRGDIQHLRFAETWDSSMPPQWDRMDWHFAQKKAVRKHACNLAVLSCEDYTEGDCYYLNTSEIHTIRPGFKDGAHLLLLQYADTNTAEPGKLYVPRLFTPKCAVDTRPMTEKDLVRAMQGSGLPVPRN